MVDPNDLIDAYLLGKLSPEERDALEKTLSSDPDLSKELEFRTALRAGLQEAQAEDVRARIQAFANRKPTTSPGRYWLVAASIVLILGIGSWFLLQSDPLSGQEIFAAYYHPEVQLDQSRNAGDGPSLPDTLSERYAQKDFSFLQKRLAQLPDSAKNWNLRILEAVSLIELGQDALATAKLSDIISGSAAEFADQARWLQALVHVRNEQYALAEEILTGIAGDSSQIHQKEAAEVLEKIRKKL